MSNPIGIHLVGSIPLPDTDSVFRKLASTVGRHVLRLPDGETGIRQMWIKFLQDRIAEHPAIEIADDLAPFRFVQFDGRLVREISRKRVRRDCEIDPRGFASGYADMAIESWSRFANLQRLGVIPEHIKFQVSLPTPIAPTYNNMVPDDRPRLLRALTRHFIDEVRQIAAIVPHERLSLQWDVCQEVLAWEGYYEAGPVDFRTETLSVLEQIGNAVPPSIDLGFHLCYGSPADQHLLLPADTGIMVEIANAVGRRIARPIQYFHMPVPRDRTDDAFFAPLERLAPGSGTRLYLGLVHHDDAGGDIARLKAAQRHALVHGVATECGMARGDPNRLDRLLAAHLALVERFSE